VGGGHGFPEFRQGWPLGRAGDLGLREVQGSRGGPVEDLAVGFDLLPVDEPAPVVGKREVDPLGALAGDLVAADLVVAEGAVVPVGVPEFVQELDGGGSGGDPSTSSSSSPARNAFTVTVSSAFSASSSGLYSPSRPVP